jgi:septation ring formation regulator EzrA
MEKSVVENLVASLKGNLLRPMYDGLKADSSTHSKELTSYIGRLETQILTIVENLQKQSDRMANFEVKLDNVMEILLEIRGNQNGWKEALCSLKWDDELSDSAVKL